MVAAIDKRLSRPVTAADRKAFNLKQIQDRWSNLRAIWKQSGVANAIDPTTLPQLVPLTEQRIADCLQILRECQRTWQIERQVMLYLSDSEVHKHPSVQCGSFGLFLKTNYNRKDYLRYLKEIAIGRRERLLGIPIATYSRDQFLRMERFRCFVPKGSGQSKPGGNLQGVRPGVKEDDLQIERMKECWQIACELSNSSHPETHHIESAAEEMNRRYPGAYRELKPRNSAKVWKARAIAAESQVQQLKEQVILAESRIQKLESMLAKANYATTNYRQNQG